MDKYKVIKMCRIDGKNRQPGEIVELETRSALVKALLRFAQIELAPAELALVPEPQSEGTSAPAPAPVPPQATKAIQAELMAKGEKELRTIAKANGVKFDSDTTKNELVKAMMRQTGYSVD